MYKRRGNRHFIHAVIISGMRLKVGISIDARLIRADKSHTSMNTNRILKLIYKIAFVRQPSCDIHSGFLFAKYFGESRKEYILVGPAMEPTYVGD